VLVLLLLVCPIWSGAQNIGVQVYGGGNFLIDKAKKNSSLKRQDGEGGYLAGAEAYIKAVGWQFGLGVSAERLSLWSPYNILNPNGQEIGPVKNIVASPAVTIYGLVARQFPMGKSFFTPQLMAGYVTTVKGTPSETQFVYSSSGGLNIGVAATIGYYVGIFNFGVRTGLSYYVFNLDKAVIMNREVRLISIPVAVSLGLDL
jgi:hypothetical protein